jgi:hypothetical protein
MMRTNCKGEEKMRKIGLLSLTLMAFAAGAPQPAYAQCGPLIFTAENQLQRMAENQAGDKYAVDAGLNWRMDLDRARELLEEAKAANKEGDETTCLLMATGALKRLGNGSWAN